MSDKGKEQDGYQAGYEQQRVLVVVRDLPDDANLLAQEVAENYQSRIKQPLEEFLAESADIEGVEGVGIVIWQRPNLPHFLSLYACTDFTDLGQQQERSPRKEVLDAFEAHFKAPEVDGGLRINIEFGHINTRPGGMSRVISLFPNLPDPFTGKSDPDEVALLARVAIPQRNKHPLGQ